MRIRWTGKALDKFDAAEYIAADNPTAVKRVAK